MKTTADLSKFVHYLTLACFFSILSISLVQGDLVTLTTGSEIFGEVTFEGEKTVKIKTPTGNLEFPTERVQKIVKESPAINYSKFGKYYFDRKDYKQAIEYYKKALEEDPANLSYQAKITEAEDLGRTLRAGDADTYLKEGDRYFSQNRLLDALDAYTVITTMDLNEEWIKKAKERIASVYIEMANKSSEPRKREELVYNALAADPSSAAAHYELAVIYMQKQANDFAMNELRKSVQLDPDFVKARRLLGNLYYDQGKYLEATAQYEQLKKLNSGLFPGVKQFLINSYQSLGNQSFQEGKFQEAQLWFEKYLELDPSGNWNSLYLTQYTIRRLSIDPESAEDHFNLGLWCQDKNLHDEALNEFKTAYRLDISMLKAKRKVIELYDKFASSLYKTGSQNLANRQYSQAILNFSRITAVYPESSFSPEARRLIRVSREQWAESIYIDAKAAFESNYFDRALDGFNNIVQNFSDTNRFVDAQRMLVRTKAKTRFEETAGDERKQKLDELQKIIDASAGEDRQAWIRIKEMETMAQWDFEARLTNLNYRERNLVRTYLDKVVYLFYDPERNIDKLRSVALKYSMPISDRSKVRNEKDYVKLMQFALILGTSIGDNYYNAWQELIPYFGTSRSELEDAKSGLSQDSRWLIEENGAEVYRVLNLRAN